MPAVLTNNSRIMCTGGGRVSASAGHKLKVGGSSVLTPNDVAGAGIPTCGTSNDSNNGNKKCNSVSNASGSSAKLKVNSTAVAIASLTGESDGKIGGTPERISASAGQSTLIA